jgi:ATP-dependent RNA helicase DeaD
MPQTARDRVMKKLRDGNLRLLVATDVVGRGIDVTRISHIINLRYPVSSVTIMSTASGAPAGWAAKASLIRFVTPEEGNELTRIEQRINLQLVRR